MLSLVYHLDEEAAQKFMPDSNVEFIIYLSAYLCLSLYNEFEKMFTAMLGSI